MLSRVSTLDLATAAAAGGGTQASMTRPAHRPPTKSARRRNNTAQTALTLLNTYGSSEVWHEPPEHAGNPGTSVGWLNSYTNTGASLPFCSCASETEAENVHQRVNGGVQARGGEASRQTGDGAYNQELRGAGPTEKLCYW